MDRVFSLLAIAGLCMFLSSPSNAMPPPDPKAEVGPSAATRSVPAGEVVDGIEGVAWDEETQTLTINIATLIEEDRLRQIELYIPKALYLIIKGGVSEPLQELICKFEELPVQGIAVRDCYDKQTIQYLVFAHTPSLTTLAFEDMPLNSGDVKDIVAWMPDKVTSLNFVRNSLGPDWATEVLQNAGSRDKLARLQRLSLAGNRMGDQVEEHASPLPRRGWLPYTETLSTVMQTTLQQWRKRLPSWVFGPAEASPGPSPEEERVIAFLAGLNSLRFLDLSSCRLGDGGIKALCAADLPELQELILRNNLLDDLRVVTLVKREWSRLETFDLSDNLVRLVGGVTLAKSLPCLRILRLQNNMIRYKEAMRFMGAEEITLNGVDLRDNILSKSEGEALQQSSPNIKLLLGNTRIDVERERLKR